MNRAAELDRHHPVAAHVDHQRRHSDRRQHRAQVGLGDHLQQLAGHAGAGGGFLHPRPPLGERPVVGLTGSEQLDQRALAPLTFDRVQEQLALVGRDHPLAVRGHARQDERADAVRVGGGEQRRQPQIAGAEDRGLVGADRLEHRVEVVHLLLERWRRVHGIRQPGAPPVEQDQPRERRQALEAVSGSGLLPQHLQMRRGAGDHDQIARPVARDLISDAGIAAVGVASPGCSHDGVFRRSSDRDCNGGSAMVYKHMFGRRAGTPAETENL
jgi:hypothetical protein